MRSAAVGDGLTEAACGARRRYIGSKGPPGGPPPGGSLFWAAVSGSGRLARDVTVRRAMVRTSTTGGDS